MSEGFTSDISEFCPLDEESSLVQDGNPYLEATDTVSLMKHERWDSFLYFCHP